MIFINNKQLKAEETDIGDWIIDPEYINELIGGISNRIDICMIYESDIDLFRLLLLKSYIDKHAHNQTHLILPYIPYMNEENVLESDLIKYICDYINRLNFSEVITFDCHHEALKYMINNFVNINAIDTLVLYALNDMISSRISCRIPAQKTFEIANEEQIYLVYPDIKAYERYKDIFKYEKVLIYDKEIDYESGLPIGAKLLSDMPETPIFKAIIIDDICATGGKIVSVADHLKEIGAEKIYLTVTNCDQSIYAGSLLSMDLIDMILTTNGLLTTSDINITAFDWNSFI